VVETDGDSHVNPGYDAWRDRKLETYGFRVVRFWDTGVYENLDGVLDLIWRQVQSPDAGSERFQMDQCQTGVWPVSDGS